MHVLFFRLTFVSLNCLKICSKLCVLFLVTYFVLFSFYICVNVLENHLVIFFFVLWNDLLNIMFLYCIVYISWYISSVAKNYFQTIQDKNKRKFLKNLIHLRQK